MIIKCITKRIFKVFQKDAKTCKAWLWDTHQKVQIYQKNASAAKILPRQFINFHLHSSSIYVKWSRTFEFQEAG